VAANVTASPAIATPVTPFLTVALTVEVLVPLAGSEDGVAVMLKLFGTGVWVTTAEPLPLEIASVALTVHGPAVVEEV